MNLIKLLDIANPKTIKDTINTMIGITNTTNTNASNAVTTANEAKALSQTAATNSASAKQTAEEALAIAETAENTAAETIAVAEQAAADAEDAVDTAELALNTANAARSAVDQALDLGQLGTFVHNTSGIALAHAYMTDSVNQTDDTALDRYYIATPKLVRDALNNYYNKSEIDTAFEANRNRNTYSITLTHDIPFSDPSQPFLAVKFLTIDCSTFNQYMFIKLSARSFKNTNLSTSTSYSHSGYFCEDIYIYKMKGTQPFIDIYNYAHDVDFYMGFGDGKAYTFGDIFWTIDNNVYTFYMICRDSSSTQFTPFTIIETSSASNTDLSTIITQYSGTAEYYTTGQRYNRNVGSNTYNNKVVTHNDLNYYVDRQYSQTIAGQKTFNDPVIFNGGFTDGNNQNYSVKLPDTTGWTADKILATTDQISTGASNPNLLINGDFSINQRGLTSYTTNGYTVDRWYNNGLTINAQYTNRITINSTSQNTSYFLQSVSLDYSWFLGKTITISADVRAITVPSGKSIKLYFKNCSSMTTTSSSWESDEITTTGKVSFTVTLPNVLSTVRLVAGIKFTGGSGSSITLNYIKVELGNTATPLIPRPYYEELSLCQAYYRKIKGGAYTGFGTGIIFNKNRVEIFIAHPVSMNSKTPTLITSGNGTIRVTQNNASYGVIGSDLTLSLDTNACSYDSVMLRGDLTNDLPSTSSGVLLQANNDDTAYIAFDAEVY